MSNRIVTKKQVILNIRPTFERDQGEDGEVQVRIFPDVQFGGVGRWIRKGGGTMTHLVSKK